MDKMDNEISKTVEALEQIREEISLLCLTQNNGDEYINRDEVLAIIDNYIKTTD